MPFQSKAQMRAAFAGALGPTMQAKTKQWAHETPDPKRLPEHKHVHASSPLVHGMKRAVKT